MVGNFKILGFCFFIWMLNSCNNTNQNKDVGNKLIANNLNLFKENLYKISNESTPKFFVKEVGSKNFISDQCGSIIDMGGLNLIENCKKDYFELINKEGFEVNDSTRYIPFKVSNLPKKSGFKLISSIDSVKQNIYQKVEFSNLYFSDSGEKAFIIVRETDRSNEKFGGKVDIYFFKNQKNMWKFYKKIMLLTA